uniref:Uncharacterized protein n=1 Tax=Chelativorans sp. (strain BNC1) TaxID=266779 RepID=Q11HM0_CHESB
MEAFRFSSWLFWILMPDNLKPAGRGLDAEECRAAAIPLRIFPGQLLTALNAIASPGRTVSTIARINGPPFARLSRRGELPGRFPRLRVSAKPQTP